MAGLARRADAGAGWESIWVYDHFHTVPEPTQEATHEAWTLMAAFAAVDPRVRLGQMCTCMGYRNPAYLAKVAATIDIISGAGVEMGIGAGWYEHEWRAYGYGFPSARVSGSPGSTRASRSSAQLWTTGTATLQGKHYQVDGAICRRARCRARPRRGASTASRCGSPVAARRRPCGSPREYADYTNFDGAPEGFEHKSEVLRGHCADVGRDFDEIVRRPTTTW